MKTFIKKRWVKHYHRDNKNRYWHLIVDSLSLLIILALLLTDAYLSAKNYGDVLGTQSQANININQNQNIDNQASTSDDLKETQTPPVILPTAIQFQSLAKYYTVEGEQLGLGPIPPVAGQATKYWLFIKVGNFTHDLSDVLVTGKLPSNVSLTGKSSVTWGENITFNIPTREIKWLLGNLSVDNNQEPKNAAFEIEVIPEVEQIGQPAILLDQLEISALDTAVNQVIKQTSPAVTSNLTADSDGLVQDK